MRSITLLTMLLLLSTSIDAQESLNYQQPSPPILQLADYERPPSVTMDSKKEYMLLLYRSTYKTLEDLNQDELRLGGLRINPATNISSTVTYFNNLKISRIREQKEIQVQNLPPTPRISNIRWSPDEKKIAFTNTTASGLSLWVLDLATATAKQVSIIQLNANLGNPYIWCNDSEQLLVKAVPLNKSALIDPRKDLPTGPIISNADGSKSQNRTYQDLLKNQTDEANFERIATSELIKINLNGTTSSFKSPAMYVDASYSPDGKYLLLTTLKRPFSYLVPYHRFPATVAVYDQQGALVKTIMDVPLAEIMPKGFMAVRKGRRDFEWRNDKPATLFFVEALDEGNPENKVPFRDELYLWDAPFAGDPVSIMKTGQRFSNIIWGNDQTAIVTEAWYDTRNVRNYLLKPSSPQTAARLLSDRNMQDAYADPGNFETVRNIYGRQVLALDGDNAFLIGTGYTDKGQFPFIDAINLKTLQKKRLYQSTYTDKKEDIFSLEDFRKGEALVMIQSKNEYPNYYIRNIRKKNSLQQITHFQNPFAAISNVHKEVIRYKRKDGLDLSGTLYLPLGYDRNKKSKLPLLIWAYPTEYKDKNSAGQNTQNPNEFTYPNYGSFVYWVTKGYAVLDDASFPIVGEGKTEPNDNFIEQLVDNAAAAIEAVDKLGYIDPKRVGIGGHSYGAFMTANLLSHSNLFACGIARSGAYNRTLTPFGFQREQRNYWEAKNVYDTMSPFMHAEKMKTPLLLIHGEADNNPGTFTLQTERYFQAIKGLGGPARMVLLPKESHGYAAKENIFHMLWEQEQFLDKYLKNSPAATGSSTDNAVAPQQ